MCCFSLGSYKSGIESDFSLRSMWPSCVAKTCVPSAQLPVHRNVLPMACESKSFRINHVDSIILYSCLPYISFTFSPLTKILLHGARVAGLCYVLALEHCNC